MTDKTFVRRWLMFVGALLPLTALWALSNPLFASPDETTHMVRAQSIASGQFDSPFITDGLPIRAAECIAFQSEETAACQVLSWDNPGTEYELPTENYPPFFHAVAAIPALVTSGIWGAYAMRLWLACICVTLLGWAGALLTRPGSSPWLLVGLCLAVPPMGIFTMATVNPTGLSVASSVLLVAGLLSLRTGARRSPEVVTAVIVGSIGLVIIRRDGVISLLAIALIFAPIMVQRLPDWRNGIPTGRRAAMAVAGLAVFAYMSFAWAGPTIASFVRDRATSGGTDPWEAARYIRSYLNQLIGNFGWLDAPIGEEAFLLAMIVASFVVILGLVGTNRRSAASTAIALALLLLAPVVFGMIRFPYLQGRYLLPIWVCLMLVAAASSASITFGTAFNRRATSLLLAVWLAVHVTGFLQNLRRYTVGRSGSWGSILDSEWHPPMMSNLVVLLLFVVCIGGAATIIGRMLVRMEPKQHESPAALDVTESTSTELTG